MSKTRYNIPYDWRIYTLYAICSVHFNFVCFPQQYLQHPYHPLAIYQVLQYLCWHVRGLCQPHLWIIIIIIMLAQKLIAWAPGRRGRRGRRGKGEVPSMSEPHICSFNRSSSDYLYIPQRVCPFVLLIIAGVHKYKKWSVVVWAWSNACNTVDMYCSSLDKRQRSR